MSPGDPLNGQFECSGGCHLALLLVNRLLLASVPWSSGQRPSTPSRRAVVKVVQLCGEMASTLPVGFLDIPQRHPVSGQINHRFQALNSVSSWDVA